MFKSAIMLKAGLAVSIVFVLVSMFGGAPSSVEAAPKPSKTPKPTKTHMPTRTPMPTQTNTPLPTFTLTNTPLPTFTDTPEPTFTFTPTPTDAPTPTDTPVPCSLWGSGSLEPASGARLPQILQLFASITNDCDVPLQYFWTCGTSTSSDCDTFLLNANVAPYGISPAPLTLNQFDVFDVSVYMCEIGNLSNCTQQINRQYSSIEF